MEAREIVRMVGKEFAGVSDEELDKWIEICRPLVSRKQFGNLYEQALAYLVCHKLSMSGAAYGSDGEGGGGIGGTFGMGGPFRIASYSEGEASISFSTNQQTNLQDDAEYAMTEYGLQFLTLRQSAVVPITIRR